MPLRVCLVGSRFSLKIWAGRAVYKVFYFYKKVFGAYSFREQRLWIVALSLIVVFFIVKIFIYPMLKQAGKEPQRHSSGFKLETPRANNPFSAGTHPFQEPLTNAEVFRLTNVTRAENGVPELKENFLLNAVAVERAKDMFEKQYFDHVSPTGEKASDIAQRAGYRYKNLSENIAYGSFLTNQKIINGWMQSPGHRKNLLSGQFEEIGVAVVKGRMEGDETWIAVQVFGRQSPPVDQEH